MKTTPLTIDAQDTTTARVDELARWAGDFHQEVDRKLERLRRRTLDLRRWTHDMATAGLELLEATDELEDDPRSIRAHVDDLRATLEACDILEARNHHWHVIELVKAAREATLQELHELVAEAAR